MKKILLLSFLACTTILVGCENKNNVVIPGNNTIDIVDTTNQNINEFLNFPFGERTKEAREYMNLEDELNIESLGYISAEHFVSNASLNKKENYYEMNLHFNSSKLYNKEDIENAYNLAQENGTHMFDGYTFFKNNNIPISTIYEGEEATLLQQWHNYLKTQGIVAKSEQTGIVIFLEVPNDSTKYCIAAPQRAGATGFIITAPEKEINVVLLPDDVIKIYPVSSLEYGHDDGKELTISEFYEKAINNEISSDDIIYGYEYNLNDIGDDDGYYCDYVNAVRFEDGIIKVNYKNGGV